MAHIPTLASNEQLVAAVRTGGESDRKKRIWIDLDNSPHVPFFLPIIKELEKQGVELILTARNMYQAWELVKFHHLPCKLVGGHCGKNVVLKVLYNCWRAAQLLPIIIKSRPDLAVSHGSRAQVIVCKLLGIPSILMHDYEFSTKTGFVEPDWIFQPDILPEMAMTKRLDRVIKYPGLKEDVYAPGFHPDRSVLPALGVSAQDLVVTLRPPAMDSHYHRPEGDVLFDETLQFLAANAQVKVIVLPRNAKQRRQLRTNWASLIDSGRLLIPDTPVNGLDLVWFSDLVISGGGTMNREAAALGVPVYSIFRGRLGKVDQHLAEQGRLTVIQNSQEIRTKIKLVRWNRPSQPPNNNHAALQTIVENILAIADVPPRIVSPAEALKKSVGMGC